MGLKLEIGKYYKTRDGRKVGPMVDHGWRDGSLAGNVDGDENRVFERNGEHEYGRRNLDIIAEWTDAPTGPVRTVTRKEIVPGVYGRIRVDAAIDWDKVLIGFDRSHLDDDRIKHGTLMQPMDAKQLRGLAETAIALADALEGK